MNERKLWNGGPKIFAQLSTGVEGESSLRTLRCPNGFRTLFNCGPFPLDRRPDRTVEPCLEYIRFFENMYD